MTTTRHCEVRAAWLRWELTVCHDKAFLSLSVGVILLLSFLLVDQGYILLGVLALLAFGLAFYFTGQYLKALAYLVQYEMSR